MKNYLYTLATTVATAGINEGAAKTLIQSYYRPALNILLFVIPIGTIIACLVVLCKWLAMDEDEKEQKKPGRIIKKIVFWGIVGTSIVAVLAIFGLVAG